jgi:hypothetical protein
MCIIFARCDGSKRVADDTILTSGCNNLGIFARSESGKTRPQNKGASIVLRTKSIVFSLIMLVISAAVFAENAYVNIENRLSPEQMHATGLDTLSPEQLQQLNLVLRDDAVKAAAAVKTTAQAQSSGLLLGLDVEPIHSRLKGSIDGWQPGTVFELENGQKWQVLKGEMKLRKPMDAPEILVVPGMAGRWFLQVDEDLPKARVYRID